MTIAAQCCHLKCRGGSKGAVRRVWAQLAANRFVLKTDIKLYYASIDHHLLLDRLAALRLTMHPAKTFIGRIDKGFDFLGYHFGPEGLSLAGKTVRGFVARATQLYEQGPGPGQRRARLGQYVQRWTRWARGGLGDVPLREDRLPVLAA